METEMVKKRYKYITIKLADTPLFPKEYSVYRVENNRSRDTLGFIEWHAAWHLWEFCPNGGTAFSSDCLEDIQDFIRMLTNGK